jgi:hypothetical protein
MTREIALSVGGETAPLLIAPAEEKVWEVAPDSKLQVPLRLIRRTDIQGDVKLRPSQRMGDHIRVNEPKFSSGQNEAFAEITVGSKAPPGTVTIGFLAVAKLPASRDSDDEDTDEDEAQDMEVHLPATSVTLTVGASSR